MNGDPAPILRDILGQAASPDEGCPMRTRGLREDMAIGRRKPS